jgi:predicted nucleotidyltransferase
MNFKKIIESKDYDFLRENEKLKNNIAFLTLGGSYAYGTNIETSDIDIRGCALNSKNDLLGFSNFEQFINEQTDTVIYSFNKLISLILNCNPNTIELLGCEPEHYLQVSDIGQSLLANKKLFLSKRAINSFGGYANQQLRRLQNALAHDAYPAEEKEKHIMGSCQMVLNNLEKEFKDKVSFLLKDEILINANLENYPLREFINLISNLNNTVKNYDKLNKRNNKKDDLHLNKHAMHLVRLYLMCFDILEKEEIITYRPEREFLLQIRNGYYMNKDGTFNSSFFDLINTYEKRLEYDKNNTNLPEQPNIKQVEEFVISVNEQIVKGEK